ncbi:MAG TPA: hypothetical protein DEB40_03405 [Elusimicrobia bacterium]|nr:hypothetical protein [Elusimicrobiota bacterium]HBT60775.1 hypothetical protein [Elusimicrobiota bacterium]
MALFATERKTFGFKKEASRGIGEAAPAKFLAVGADSEFHYSTALIADEKIRGLKDRFPSVAGILSGTGNLNAIDVEAATIGDLLFGCLGAVATTQPDVVGAPTVFQHSFTRLNALLMPSFSYFVDRGLSVKRYPLSVIKKLSFKGTVNGKAQVDADLLFKTEESASAFASSYGVPKPLMFFQTDFKVEGASDINVKSWSLSIDNNSEALRSYNLSRDARDIISKKPFEIDGTFELFFESEAQRAKFLVGTASALNIILTGDILQGTQKAKLELSMQEVKYSAYPFGNIDDLLGAAVAFHAEFDPVAQKSLEVILTNQVTGY